MDIKKIDIFMAILCICIIVKLFFIQDMSSLRFVAIVGWIGVLCSYIHEIL